MDERKHIFTYSSSVTDGFGREITHRWEADTIAISEKKARANLIYRFKKEHGLANTAKIILPGKLHKT